jgi:hypothetical protein
LTNSTRGGALTGVFHQPEVAEKVFFPEEKNCLHLETLRPQTTADASFRTQGGEKGFFPEERIVCTSKRCGHRRQLRRLRHAG